MSKVGSVLTNTKDDADDLWIMQDTISTTQMRLNAANNRREEDQEAIREIRKELEKAQAKLFFHQLPTIMSLS
jgi:chaperonin cofactor prefoldin